MLKKYAEEELEEIRCEADAKLLEKENEICNLKEQLQLFQHCHIPHNGTVLNTCWFVNIFNVLVSNVIFLFSVCSTDIAVQVSDLETGSWGSDRTFIVKPRNILKESQQEV